jgi:hypothetical protein
MKKKVLRIALGALALGLFIVPVHRAMAHQPNVFEDGELLVVDDPLLSFALYGNFESPDSFFEASMQLEKPLAIPVEILVAARDDLRDHRPLFAIVGPRLPEPTEAEKALLPRPLPDGMGVVISRYEREDREILFESYTRRAFWTNGVVAYVLPAGDVRLWVWSPEGTTGKFVLGFGVEEGGQDLGGILSRWSDYAY